MKKELKIIDTYIKTVSKEIKDRKVKRELKEELFSHLIEIYERNIALGMSDENAQKDAVSHMGDSEAVAQTFKNLYPISTNRFLQKLTSPLAYSFAHFFITIWGLGFDFGVNNARILLAFGIQIVVFWCFRNINKYFKIALNTTIINCVSIVILGLLNKYLIFDYLICTNIINFVFGSIKYIFYFRGLQQIEKDTEVPKNASISPRVSAILMVVTHAIVFSTFYIDSELFIIPLVFGFFTAIYPIIMAGASYDLLDSVEWDIEKTKRDKRISIIAILVFSIILSLFQYLPIPSPKLEDIQSSNSNKAVDTIRQELITLGLPENIAYDLPDNEIMLYDNAKVMIEDIEDDKYVTLRNYGYAFYIFDDNDNLDYVRILICLNEFDNFSSFYRDGIYVYLSDETEFDYFTYILCESGGQTKSVVPIYNNLTNTNKSIGCEFSLPKDSQNERLYISASMDATTDISSFGLFCSYYHTELSDCYRTFQAADIRKNGHGNVVGFETIRNGFKNPFYIEPEEPEIVFPEWNNVTELEETEDITDIDELIEYWNP